MLCARHIGRSVVLPLLLTALALLATLSLLNPARSRAALSPTTYTVSPLCSAPAPGRAACFGLKLVKRATLARRAPAVSKPQPELGSLSPLRLQSAYTLPSTPPSPQTIAIVDAYDDPTAAADLAVYDHQFFEDEAEFPSGPPTCQLSNGIVTDPVGGPSADGCFLKVNQRGETDAGSMPEFDAGWSGEIATDIEIAHGLCRSCRILLVEAESNFNSQLNIAENRAATLGADEISDSWGGPESPSAELPAKERAAFEHPGVVITVASGDNGYLDWGLPNAEEQGHANFPASSPNVVAVGGTRLTLTAGGARQSETVWNGVGASGGGCSEVFTAQLWQQNAAGFSALGCPSAHRAVADVAAVADPYTGIAVYNSQEDGSGDTGWITVGGTSVASPVIAAVFALAGGAGGVPIPAQTLYQHHASAPGSLFDVVKGSNGRCTEPLDEEPGPDFGTSGCTSSAEAKQCSSATICLASSGYDGPSGVGSPIGVSAFQATGSPAEEPKPEPEPKAEPKPEPKAEAEGGSGAKGGAAATGGSGLPVATNPLVGVASPFGGTLTPTGVASSAVPRISRLALTATAVAALNRGHPTASKVAFGFTLNVAAKVRVSLTKRVTRHGHARWQTLPGSITLSAHAGRDRGHLKGGRTLSAGRYRLTSSPAHGAAASIAILIG